MNKQTAHKSNSPSAHTPASQPGLSENFVLSAGRYTCRILSPGDAEQLTRARIIFDGEVYKDPRWQSRPEMIERETREELSEPHIIYTGTFDEHSTLVGYGKTTKFKNSYHAYEGWIDPAHRGRGLSYISMQMRMIIAHLAGPDIETMKCSIAADNAPSIAAAHRAGYKKLPQSVKKPGKPVHLDFEEYHLDLAASRAGKLKLDLLTYNFD